MSRIKYLTEKIRRAWLSNTLKEKGIRFLGNQTKRYIFIPLKSTIQSTKNLQLNLTDGFLDHRSSENFISIQPEQIIRIIKAYKLW